MRLRLTSLLLLAALLVPPPAFSDDPRPQPPELPPAKTVTLDGTMKLKAALAALEKQTKITVEDRRDEADKDIEVHCRNVPFWQALDQIAAAAGAEVELYSADGKVALRQRAGKKPLKGPQTVSYDGRFRTALKRVTGSVDPETGETTYAAVLEVAWEPGTQPFFLNTWVDDLAVDDQKAPHYGGKHQFVFRQNAEQFDTLIPPPPRDAKKIGVLSGKASVIAPTRLVTFPFGALDGLKAKARQEDGKVVCQIDELKLNQTLWSVKVSLSYPPGNAKFDDTHSPFQMAGTNELVLESKDGKRRLVAVPDSILAATTTSVVAVYNFRDDPKANRLRGEAKDWNLSFRAPAAVVKVPVSFTFKDVPLP
jgi:hypothetical protein